MIGLSSGTVKVNGWANPNTPVDGGGDVIPDFAFESLVAVDVPRVVNHTGEIIVVVDRVVSRPSSATYHDKQMHLFYIGEAPSSVNWASSNPAVATVDEDGFVTHLNDGGTTITATSNGFSISTVITLSVSLTSPDILIDYVAGSLAKHVSDAVDSRLAGKSASTAKALFSSQVHTGTPSYTRNTGAWCADLGSALCSISPYNSTEANKRAGIVTSPVHILFAAHYQINSGATVRFLAGNTVVDRVLVSKLTHPNYNPYYPDICIGRLDSPLPETVPPCRVLPADWANYLPTLYSINSPIPSFGTDQDEKALVADLYSAGLLANFILPSSVNWEKRFEFYEDKVGGDSGNPAFLIINDQLVLLTVWTYGGAGAGTFITPHIATINSMMSQLGGNYSLQQADLSGFTIFS